MDCIDEGVLYECPQNCIKALRLQIKLCYGKSSVYVQFSGRIVHSGNEMEKGLGQVRPGTTGGTLAFTLYGTAGEPVLSWRRTQLIKTDDEALKMEIGVPLCHYCETIFNAPMCNV